MLSAVALALLGCNAPARSARDAAPMAWMAGYWLSCEGGRETVENWIGAGTGRLLGVNSSRDGFEFLRVAPNGRGGTSYYSMPNGAPVTEFALTEQADWRVVFANPNHDFPQRIIYQREGDTLMARIEGDVGGRVESAEWRFTLRPPESYCSGS